MWTPFVICQRYIKFGRSEVGTGLYPQALFLVLFNVAGRRIRVCGLLSRCWMVDSDFCVCSVRLPIVDGTGVFVVWWSVKFVFRIVDGTGMFSVSSW